MQLRVRRLLALNSEILRCFHQSNSKELLPVPIDDDPGCQWVVRGDQPPGEPEAVLRGIGWKLRETEWDADADFNGGLSS